MAYHLSTISRGNFGDFSKIEEEFLELSDSIDQSAKIMILNELADLIGAIEGYLEKNFSGITLEDVLIMKDFTKKAFLDGTRTSK